MMEDQNSINESENNGLDIKAIVNPYLVRWKLIATIVFFFVLAGFLYARYKIPVFEATAKILVNTDNKGSSRISELAAFDDLGIFDQGGGTVLDQMEILRSRRLISEVVKEKKLNTVYRSIGGKTGLTKRVVYGDLLPFRLLIENENDMLQINMEVVDTNLFRINSINSLDLSLNLKTDELTYFDSIGFKIVEVAPDIPVGSSFEITHLPIDMATDMFLEKLNTESIDKKANTIVLKIRDESPQRATIFLNELLRQYNMDAVADKNKVAANTVDFINERMRLITIELGDVEQTVEKFKTQRGLVDIPSESKIFLEDESYISKEIVEVATQVELAQFVLDYLNQDTS
ncbi:MAG: Wzz/FepE/Etk N-terminal domain-containing protein, partial [Brumimicrobium sp.]|nr:Wzz/FepE/Etk N-terminal domain-containing protein [Brumimicrobium sp.]